MNLNLKSLIGRLNDTCRKGLEAAAGLCLSRTNYDIEIEHWLVKLVEPRHTDVERILQRYEVNQPRLLKDLTKALDRLKTGNARTPALSPRLPRLIQDAWLLASVEFGAAQVRSGHLLLAMLADEDLGRLAREISREFHLIKPEALRAEFDALTAASDEAKASRGLSSTAAAPSGDTAETSSSDNPQSAIRNPQSLDQFTIDLTARAKAGQIDPVLGRDFEIRQIVDILTRRRQNNPILTGEAGVGKTAVVEGFALRVAQGDVPPALANVAVRLLDLGLLQAGAGIKGEFENRLKSVIEEVKGSLQPIILFIDEAHTMIGAGGQAGQNDAANLLKPALARGELRTIAATTWAEYKKYFEKDAALARRFQVVKVEEPSEEQAVGMMRGIMPMLEKHHGVRILDEAVVDSVKLSHRYIAGRQLPDKSVSVLDTACARVAIGHAATPPPVEDALRRITRLSVEIDALARETATGANFQDRIAELTTERAAAEEELQQLQTQWATERDLVARIRALREELEAAGSRQQAAGSEEQSAVGGGSRQSAGAESSDSSLIPHPSSLTELSAELAAVQGARPLLQPCVTSQAIAEVIAGWTGIPIGKMVADEIQTVLALQDRLGARVIGQDDALIALSQRIRTARANLTDPRRPVGVFLLVGPSGVGKTETALALADTLYGGERNLVTINMSEYQEAHTVSSLKGSPPGYVGYGEGGVLTEAVRRKPYSVVLLDEVEKAHPDVMELFYQVFDKGQLEDGEGREIDFKNTVILLTSNTGSDLMMKLCADPDTAPDAEGLAEAIRPELLKVFKPALLGRMAVVPYFPLSEEVMRSIIRLQLGRVGSRLKANHNAAFSYEDALVDAIAARCREVESGARNVDHILTRTLLPEMSGAFLSRMASGEGVTRVHIGVGAEGQFSYEIA